MPQPKGTRPPNAGIGRQKGIPNKMTRELRAIIEGALHKLGGEKWLIAKAEEEPAAFMALLGKCLPRDIRLGGNLQLRINLFRPANDERPAGD